MRRLAIIILFLFPATTVQAATYYIDASVGSSGDGLTWGTAKKTWIEMDTLLDALPGDGAGATVEVNTGSYGEMFKANGIFTKGRSDWLIIQAASGAIVDFNSINVKITGGGNGYIKFSGFRVNYDGSYYPAAEVGNGGVSFNIQNASYIRVCDCNVYGPRNYPSSSAARTGFYAPYFPENSYGIWVNNVITGMIVNDIIIENSHIQDAFRGIQTCTKATNVIIKNCVFGLFGEDSIHSTQQWNLIIQDNVFNGPLNYRKTEIKIAGTQTGTFAVGEIVIQDVTDATGVIDRAQATGGINLFQTSEIPFSGANNTIRGATGSITSVSYNPAHTDHIQHENYLSALPVSGHTIQRNICRDPNIAGCGGANLIGWTFNGEMTSCSITDNLLYGSPSQVMNLEGVNDINVINNTIINLNKGTGTGFRVSLAHATTADVNTVVTNFFNNIIYAWAPLVIDADKSGHTSRIVNNGSNIWPNNPNNVGGTYKYRLDNSELINQNIPAQFQDYNNKDFNLVYGSVAINFGNANYALDTDIRGYSRMGLPDAGCYEYQGYLNHAPVFDAVADQEINEGEFLTFGLHATDEDPNEIITYSLDLENYPRGLILTGTDNNIVEWMPDSNQAGIYVVRFWATDGKIPVPLDVNITVFDVNEPENNLPVLDTIGPKSVDEMITLTIVLNAVDADQDPCIYSIGANTLPDGWDLTDNTFTWTPDYTQSGTYLVAFRVSDGKGMDAEVVTITVNNINRVSVTPLGNFTRNAGYRLKIPISAADVNGETLTYTTSTLPVGAIFANQVFTWPVCLNSSAIQFTATDAGGDSASVWTYITVNKLYSITVSGETDPDCTGVYKIAGNFLNYPYYVNTRDPNFVCWYAAGAVIWVINKELGYPDWEPGYWYLVSFDGTNPTGTYIPWSLQGEYTGELVVRVKTKFENMRPVMFGR